LLKVYQGWLGARSERYERRSARWTDIHSGAHHVAIEVPHQTRPEQIEVEAILGLRLLLASLELGVGAGAVFLARSQEQTGAHICVQNTGTAAAARDLLLARARDEQKPPLIAASHPTVAESHQETRGGPGRERAV